MRTPTSDHVRAASTADVEQLLTLWASEFGDDDLDPPTPWQENARRWFARAVEDPSVAHFPVIEIDGDIVATAIGTLELGVPNPQCPQGRTVRLMNVITLPAYRRQGYGTLLVGEVVAWARSIDADRVDLSTTPDGQRIYDQAGFVPTRAPRMKLVL